MEIQFLKQPLGFNSCHNPPGSILAEIITVQVNRLLPLKPTLAACQHLLGHRKRRLWQMGMSLEGVGV